MAPNYDKLLAKKLQKLQDLEDELITAEKQLGQCRYEREALEKKKRQMMLVEAGKVIERAGLLEDYDEDELYLLLVMNKNQLTKKKG